MNDSTELTTLTPAGVTPDQIEQEARRFAMRAGSTLLLKLADHGITEKNLAEMLDVHPRQIRTIVVGDNWKAYVPLVTVFLALETELELGTKNK